MRIDKHTLFISLSHTHRYTPTHTTIHSHTHITNIHTQLDADDPLSYTEHYLLTLGLGKARATDARPDPRVVRALDTLLLVHADHELNCSTAAVRHLTT